jgi:hypothetical protein
MHVNGRTASEMPEMARYNAAIDSAMPIESSFPHPNAAPMLTRYERVEGPRSVRGHAPSKGLSDAVCNVFADVKGAVTPRSQHAPLGCRRVVVCSCTERKRLMPEELLTGLFDSRHTPFAVLFMALIVHLDVVLREALRSVLREEFAVTTI